jgi:hypothetical protein
LQIVHNFLDKLQNNNYNIVVGGDFNVHFNNGNADNNTCLLNDLLNSYGLRSLVTFPTRVETTLDNVFTNIQSDYCLAVQPLDFALSDHIGILLNWSVNIPDSEPTLKTIRPITNYGKFLFYHLISNNNWDFIDSDCLKRSIVIPIFKKGDRNDCKNYRPISLLPVFQKFSKNSYFCKS